MRKAAFSLLPLLILVLSACAPEITNLQVVRATSGDVPQHQDPLRVISDIVVRQGGAGTPEVDIRPVWPKDGNFVPAGTLPNRVQIGTVNGHGLYRYSGEVAGLDYGAYDLRLSVDYREYLSVKTRTLDLRFFVEAPPECFSFDPGFQGFSLGPVRKSDGSMYSETVPLSGQYLNWPIDDWPDAAGRHRSVSFDISVQTFPSPPAEPYYWFIDFISPELSALEGWQQSRGLTFRVATRAGSVYAQPLIKIAGRDPLAPRDEATGKFLLYPLADGSLNWKVISWDGGPGLPEGARERVMIRIYGDARATAINNDVTVFLDGVCPVPPGIDPPGGEVVAPIPNPWH
ncbi:hypothetical protein [Geoalkalibacter halelectricus]|uniref:Carboxypeptidase regulatory-like domain-containing protein n=1 Tax=Geoalkalibacter halelectricus TaxID=2847045 RepID=A0ABY5ZJ48_9BACT|nr:hypothetical protein [Geoalkalibacter halelectricus]MDO3378268.1 hypothetical protein [Geoalkalibacter halelectricus]UWZ79141.1 hypothetical protein L9S41_15865 [Geoalkalibacter halelectricus]